jgi:hypothetical protein
LAVVAVFASASRASISGVALAVTVYAVTRVGVFVFVFVPVCAGVYTAAYVVGAGKCGGLYPIGMWV